MKALIKEDIWYVYEDACLKTKTKDTCTDEMVNVDDVLSAIELLKNKHSKVIRGVVKEAEEKGLNYALIEMELSKRILDITNECFKIGQDAKGSKSSEHPTDVISSEPLQVPAQYNTRNKVKGYIQQSKEDWWDCKCGKQHKGFPYKCPLKEEKK